MARIPRPLDPASLAAADEQLYAAHQGDPRPNSLFDAQGQRLKLDANDPSQAGLRKEWCKNYESELAKHKSDTGTGSSATTSTRASPDRAPNSPILPCQTPRSLSIRMKHTPEKRPQWWPVERWPGYAGETCVARLSNGEKTGTLDFDAGVTFNNVPEGDCTLIFSRFYENINLLFDQRLK